MSDPRAYDLSQPSEVKRLFSELQSYMRVSLKDGTDMPGRAHAYAALTDLNTLNGLATLTSALLSNEEQTDFVDYVKNGAPF